MAIKNIKAVLFDLDGTLSHHHPSGADFFADHISGLGFKISAEDKIRAEHWTHFYFARSLEIQSDSKTYADSEEAFWTNFSKRRMVALGLPSSDALELAPKISAYMAEVHRPKAFVPEDAFPMLESLKSAGYILGMASNRETPYLDKLKKLKLDTYFKFALAGGEVNSFKPHGAIFERALELAGVSASETVYIGDNYYADVVGAQRAGITPVLYDPSNLFPDMQCAVIRSFDELTGLL
ncbi:MAG: HAD family hydrolase [Anaerolineales bacterium]|nr:HAD family hydrolase [Anaerolineales bacterium]